jgi:phosphomevalonate kinase
MLELIITFLGGVLLSGLIGLVVWVSSIKKKHIKLSRDTKRDFKQVENKNNELLDMVRELNEQVKMLELNVHKFVDNIYRDTDEKFQNVDRVIDSRLDKLENRLTKINEDGCETAKAVKQQLNG